MINTAADDKLKKSISIPCMFLSISPFSMDKWISLSAQQTTGLTVLR